MRVLKWDRSDPLAYLEENHHNPATKSRSGPNCNCGGSSLAIEKHLLRPTVSDSEFWSCPINEVLVVQLAHQEVWISTAASAAQPSCPLACCTEQTGYLAVWTSTTLRYDHHTTRQFKLAACSDVNPIQPTPVIQSWWTWRCWWLAAPAGKPLTSRRELLAGCLDNRSHLKGW